MQEIKLWQYSTALPADLADSFNKQLFKEVQT